MENLDELASRVIEIFREKGLSLALAESCTGGMIAETVTNVAGASDIFYGSAVTYVNSAKEHILGVARETMYLGSVSKNDNAKKLEESGAEFFKMPGWEIPLMKGCAAWVICKHIPRPENEKDFDLFVGEVVAAWADERVFKDGHWLFETAPDDMKTLHYVAGGHFYKIGEALDVPGY